MLVSFETLDFHAGRSLMLRFELEALFLSDVSNLAKQTIDDAEQDCVASRVGRA